MDTLQVRQINLQHSQSATGELVKLLTGKTGELILIQEPYVYRNQVVGLGSTGYQRIVGKEDGTEAPRTCIMASKELLMVPLPQLGTRDATAAILEYKVGGTRRKVIVSSIYLPYDAEILPPSRELENIVNFARNIGLPVVIGCDANAHHTMWGSGDVNSRGEALLEYIATTDLQVMNIGREPTFVNRIRKEVIDITLASQGISEEILGWKVRDHISMSDHRMIGFEMELDPGPTVFRRNPRVTNWEAYRDNLGHFVGRSNHGERITSTKQLDEEVGRLSTCIVSAYEEAYPLRAVGGRKVRWWNKTLEGLRRTARHAFNKAAKGGEGTLGTNTRRQEGILRRN